MALTKWEPANDVESLQSDFNRFFEGFFGRPVAGSMPPQKLSGSVSTSAVHSATPAL